METTKKVTITLKLETIEKLDNYAKLNSINKSALIDKLINTEINSKENGTKEVC
jgi:hypothetical protein